MTSESLAHQKNQLELKSKSTEQILNGPIVPVMLRLALPTLLVLVAQTFVGVIETYFVSSLGANALAGVSVVFPILMLMQMMANGGIGSGLSSAVAQACGAGNRDRAEALVWHGVIVALVFGAFFAVVLIVGGNILYQMMGVSGPALSAALAYSNAVFLASPLIWVVALLSAALRGAGDARTPARITLAGAILLLPLSPLLIFGWGPVPSFGVLGAGLAVIIYYLIATVFLLNHMRSEKSAIKLSTAQLQPSLFGDILGVGLLSAIGTIQINLTVAIVTATVGIFGSDAVAGYGIASRLEYLQVPLLFGLGTAVITMVGTNMGAGKTERAQRIAWIGAAIAFSFMQLLGIIIAIFPHLWLNIFSDQKTVLTVGESYLKTIAPFYGAIAIGMMLYFASIGMRRVLWPVLAGTARMIIAALGGWIAVTYYDADLKALFIILAISAVVYCAITVVSLLASNKRNSSAC